ncbi:MAG: exodeoxyribonuclease V subunit gamma, partial [Microthrixaceae bacterium]|nr:exodeoxyribonuclease V subunit gamma [Microthrixaceae bacterium]
RLADSPGGHTEPDPTGAPRPATVLGALQADLLADRAPSADLVPTAEDTSVVIHSCHGETRQVEVLRDQILHL